MLHSTQGMCHLDVRQSGNGILITCTPAEVDGVLAAWALRLRNDDNGQQLNELGAALARGRPHAIPAEKRPAFESVLVFIPTTPKRASERSPGSASPRARAPGPPSSAARSGR
ncbi:hypothetical protein [Streptomyces sp. NPDC057748]|uniref:hypothetical protein n=1 Tax=unclassified Streptomyces TaxID=2593676 RepID=UPI0036AB2EE0